MIPRVLPLLLAGCAPKAVPPPAPPLKVPLGVAPNTVLTGDVDGDGAPDLVGLADEAVVVALGDGAGGFTPGPRLDLEVPGHLLAAADLDGDGDLDLATAWHERTDVQVLLGDGAGAFAPAPGSPFAAFGAIDPHMHGLEIGDLDGDGAPDLTLGHQDTGAVAVLLGDGRGGFGAPAEHVLGEGFYPHDLGDLDGDGDLDLVAPDLVGSAVVVALGDGRGGLEARAPIPVRSRPFFVRLADLDADGDLDAVVTHDDRRGVDVLLGDGRGAFEPARGFRSAFPSWEVRAADVGGDGDLDLLLLGDGVLCTLDGDGRGGFAERGAPVDTGADTWKLDLADLDGDARPDVIVPDPAAQGARVLLGADLWP